jgi:hypothetical protein
MVWQNNVTRQTPVGNIAAIPASVGLAYIVTGASFLAAGGKRYGLTTTSGAITVTLPTVASNLASGLSIEVRDVARDANANHITLTANNADQIVFGAVTATNQTISTAGAIVTLIPYAANRWRAMLTASA